MNNWNIYSRYFTAINFIQKILHSTTGSMENSHVAGGYHSNSISARPNLFYAVQHPEKIADLFPPDKRYRK